jgi:hypothetical protein
MKIEAIGIKEKDKDFRVVNSALFRGECNKLDSGRYRITVEKKRNNKSNLQLGYYYACVLPMSHKLLLDAGWEFSTLEEVDIFWKSQFANREIVNRTTGEVMTIPALKRDMTTTDMMTFTNAIRDYCSEFLGGYIPEPETQIQMELK